MSDLKKAIHRQYADLDLIEVEVPEWPGKDGKPSRLRFRRRLTVDDVAAMGSIVSVSGHSVLIRLFELLAVDENGNRLVDPNDREWFATQVDGHMVAKVAARAGLQSAFGDEVGEPPDEGDSGN